MDMESTDARLARIETKVDILLSLSDKTDEKFDALDKRIGKLEKFEAKLIGMAAFSSLLISIAIKKWL